MSGASARDSMKRKTAISTPATASSPSVCTVVQPTSFPFTIAYTATMSEAVTVTAPATSSRVEEAKPLPPGRTTSERTTTAIPIGTFTRKIQFQVSASVRIPPSSTPIEPPPAATNPNTPIAFARSAGSVKSVTMSESATAETTAPPRPCTARAPISTSCEPARPQASEAVVKSTIPMTKSRRWPKRSPSLPPSSRNPPNVSR